MKFCTFISSEKRFNDLVSILAAVNEKPFDFAAIRDSFRLHVHNRRSTSSDNLVLLDEDLIRNLLALKQKTFELLQKFRDINRPKPVTGTRPQTFNSLDDFMKFVVTQQEILNSELWKLEMIFEYLDQLKITEEVTLEAFNTPPCV